MRSNETGIRDNAVSARFPVCVQVIVNIATIVVPVNVCVRNVDADSHGVASDE